MRPPPQTKEINININELVSLGLEHHMVPVFN
jgi:hypothetical protein